MHVRSLGYRTDLIFSAFNGEVIDRGDHLVIRTPSNPTYYWGNYLLFQAPPGEGDFDRWRSLFEQEIGSPPEVRHQAYGWDTTHGEAGIVDPFLKDGFRLALETVLTAQRLEPPAPPATAVALRPLRSDADWLKALENQIRCREPGHDETSFRRFKERQMASYRSMTAAGMGEWFGAFSGDELLADLGIFHDDRIARYQSVETHPGHRRQGIAGNLVYRAGLCALSHFGIDTLVIVADHESAASRLYRSIGFLPEEQQVGLERWPPEFA